MVDILIPDPRFFSTFEVDTLLDKNLGIVPLLNQNHKISLPPPGQYRRRLPIPRSTRPSPTPAARPSDSPESSPTPSIIMSPSVRSAAIATDRAFEGAVG